MERDPIYESRIREQVRRAVLVGAGDLREVCLLCQGADPGAVHRAMGGKGLTDTELSHSKHHARLGAARARRLASELLAALPGCNPDDSQWWFSLDSIERICDEIFLSTGAARPVYIGTSTLAAYYQLRFDSVCKALDVDEDVISAINRVIGPDMGRVYDVAAEPPALDPSPDVVVLDPPWYESQTRLFLRRASQLVATGSRVFCTVPRELTRPRTSAEREQLTGYAQDAGLLVEDFYRDLVEYTMPDFEKTAFRSFEKIQALPWRRADLARLRKIKDPLETDAAEAARRAVRYYRGENKKLRLFFDAGRLDPGQRDPLVVAPDYSVTVSASATDRSKVALWTSTNVAFRVRDAAVAERALKAWQDQKSRPSALATVQGDDSASLFLKTLFQSIELPDDPDSAKRTPRQIAEHRRQSLSVWAETEPVASDGDGYRNRFARDRDRILWSNGLRQLANKTQVFSTEDSDHVRQRLTHSAEVMQLASTVGSSLGLDRDLIEAGALAHDIGHTPFGHAGEVAIDKSLRAISPQLGFNHYEHGLDVVVWLEDAYRHPSNGEKFGLDLTSSVLECIFKHMFSFDTGRLSQKTLRRESKHAAILSDSPCHLEGQCVRAADKISYLISDIEDGLRLGAITLEDLRNCALFGHPPIDLAHEMGESPLATFVAQRRSVIGVLMEDLIDETARRLAGYQGRASIFSQNGYTVDQSGTIREELREIWDKVQAGKLHRAPRVVAANRRAARIVNRLLMVFTLRPDLLPPEFRAVHDGLRDTEYMSWYRKLTREAGVRVPDEASKDLALEFMIGHEAAPAPTIDDVIRAKDFVASLTDQSAMRRFHELFV